MDQVSKTRLNRGAASAPGERARARILDAAEDLFAREGPAAVTLRSIGASAGVNIAAVNYYFGSKEKLFEEMFLRRIIPLNEERLAQLEACTAEARGHPTLHAIVAAYVMPALQLMDATSASARAIVVQYSLGRVLAMPWVNDMLVRYYAQVRESFVEALQRALPDVTPHEIVWRYYWMGGSLLVALAIPPEAVEPVTSASEAMLPGRPAMAESLIAFLVQGVSAIGPVTEQANQ